MRRTTQQAMVRSYGTRVLRKDGAMAGHFLLRSSVPRRRSAVPSRVFEVQRREFFGFGEILGVITNPAETVRSLTESRRLLAEARQEITDSRERAQLRPAHTFSRLPGFFPRPAELEAIQRTLGGDPSFTVLFGASSAGKTALLREVLSMPQYHVLHFDLRIAGFNDLGAMYTSLSSQMEQYFAEITKQEGYTDFEKEAWSFKHDRLNVERRIAEGPPDGSRDVKTSDIARLMELFQSSLLKYWEFKPDLPSEEPAKEEKPRPSTSSEGKRQASSSETRNSENLYGRSHETASLNQPKGKETWSSRLFGKKSRPDLRTLEVEAADVRPSVESTREVEQEPEQEQEVDEETQRRQENERIRARKRVPVIFFDEAHKLPALIKSTEAMKCILDSKLVLTKQDRLCHVVHATSDPFYLTWLRQLNIMQHCKIITIGDCSKAEAKAFFETKMLPRVSEELRPGLHFGQLYEAFGGKLAHWSDYITDYGINIGGRLTIERSTHFLQAHALLNLHLLHSADLPTADDPEATASSGSGFKIYSPLSNQRPHAAATGTGDDGSIPAWTADFTAQQLLQVMARLTKRGAGHRSIPYFALCRELGVGAVDGMVKGRILELRWTETITREGAEPSQPRATTPVDDYRFSGESKDWVPVSPRSEEDLVQRQPEADDTIVGPVLVPTTPIMRFAMRAVLAEYEDVGNNSEYASMSDPEEY